MWYFYGGWGEAPPPLGPLLPSEATWLDLPRRSAVCWLRGQRQSLGIGLPPVFEACAAVLCSLCKPWSRCCHPSRCCPGAAPAWLRLRLRCLPFLAAAMQGVLPDIVTMAKGIGNGLPLAAVVTTPEIAQVLAARLHFNTFGERCCRAWPVGACCAACVLRWRRACGPMPGHAPPWCIAQPMRALNRHGGTPAPLGSKHACSRCGAERVGSSAVPCLARPAARRRQPKPATPSRRAGGNPVSCAAGRAVLRVIDKEGLQQNCADVGGYLLIKLRCGCRVAPVPVTVPVLPHSAAAARRWLQRCQEHRELPAWGGRTAPLQPRACRPAINAARPARRLPTPIPTHHHPRPRPSASPAGSCRPGTA